jgi:Zn-dependent protease
MGLVIFILSLTVHEYAHARVAFALGDDTASRHGRMTLNPIPHIDPIGTILLPVLGNTGIPVIGWAKPVPVNPIRLTRRMSMRAGHALVAAAGPLSNIVLAVVAVALLRLVLSSGLLEGAGVRAPAAAFLYRLFYANLGLAVFNLLPVPPLDGSRLMPRSLDSFMELMQRYSFFVFIAIIVFGGRIIWVPVAFLGSLLSLIFGVPPLSW